MLLLCCATFAPQTCHIISKLNASRSLSAGRINEAVLCTICYIAISGNAGREKLMSAGVCELLLQTGREHSNIEAVAEWVARCISAMCSVGRITASGGREGALGNEVNRSNAIMRAISTIGVGEISQGWMLYDLTHRLLHLQSNVFPS